MDLEPIELAERTVGRLVLTIAQLNVQLVKAENQNRKNNNVELDNKQWEAICKRREEDAVKRETLTLQQRLTDEAKRYVFMYETYVKPCGLTVVDIDEAYTAYTLEPNARELAMAQTKGEFPEAVLKYRTRVGLSHDDAKEKLKNALGLTDPSNVRRKAIARPRAKAGT